LSNEEDGKMAHRNGHREKQARVDTFQYVCLPLSLIYFLIKRDFDRKSSSVQFEAKGSI
jgi:hypothetical protein